MKITGELKAITEKFYTAKQSGEEVKYLEVLIQERGDDYPMSLVATVFGDKVENFLKFNKVGAYGDLQFNLRAKESNGRYFNQLSVFRFDKVNEETPAPAEPVNDDLPF